MNAQELMKCVNEIARAESRLAKAVAEYDAVKSLGYSTQTCYAIHVNGVRIQISELDQRDFSKKLIRGREMLHLGALKVMDAEIDAARVELAKAHSRMQEMTNKAADASGACSE